MDSLTSPKQPQIYHEVKNARSISSCFCDSGTSGDCGEQQLTSLSETSDNSFDVFPTQNILRVETTFDLKGASITILNAIGQPVKNYSSVNGSKISVETGGGESQ